MRTSPRARAAACLVCVAALVAPGKTRGEPEVGATVTDAEAFSFMVWGHPRGRADGRPPLHFEEILKRIDDLDPDLLVLTGDMIYGAIRAAPEDVARIVRDDFERLDAALAELGIPVFPLPGNHDVHNLATRDVYLERYPEPPYAFTRARTRFVMLDSVGIRQRADDTRPYWGADPLPFDAAQLAFLENELSGADAYDHFFVFLHHADPWVEADGFWWKDLHPRIRGSKVRAVFSGSPWSFKYAHLEEDGIHYILSATESTASVRQLAGETRINHLGANRQPDTLQRVRVDGERFDIETIVVGALDTDGLSPRFWDAVEEARPEAGPFVQRFRQALRSPRRIAAFLLVYGAVALTLGVLIGGLRRRRTRRVG